ncbi:hypothetical protein BGX27_001446 [Mortierella sp. AM989]|nr:hypothetical protein BGX27_001446 [Mortierella sp. AM989]
MADVSTLIQQQIEQLSQEYRILQDQFRLLPSKVKKKDGESDEDLILQEEESRGNRIQGLLENLIQFALPPSKEVQLAEIQRDEKVRLAEIAKAEKNHQIVTAKDEKIRLAILANEGEDRKLKIANDEKIRLAELVKEEKIRLAELARKEKVQLCKLAQKEKIRLAELANESQQRQKDEKLTLAELAKDGKVRLEELKLDETRFVEGARKELDIRLAELEMPIKRLYATRDATIEDHKSSEKKILAILKHIELVTEMTHRFKGKASNENHNSSHGVESMGSPPDYGFSDIETIVQLVERLSNLLAHGKGSVDSTLTIKDREKTTTAAPVATESEEVAENETPGAKSTEFPDDTSEPSTPDECPEGLLGEVIRW